MLYTTLSAFHKRIHTQILIWNSITNQFDSFNIHVTVDTIYEGDERKTAFPIFVVAPYDANIED